MWIPIQGHLQVVAQFKIIQAAHVTPLTHGSGFSLQMNPARAEDGLETQAQSS